MSNTEPTIIYTLTDEAPLLATRAFLPIIRTFTAPAGIRIDTADISVAARVIGEFSDRLRPEQRLPNTLAELGRKMKARRAEKGAIAIGEGRANG